MIYNYQGEIIEGDLSSQKSQLESQIKDLTQQLADLKSNQLNHAIDQYEYLQYLTIRKFQQEFNMTLDMDILKQGKLKQLMQTIFIYSLTKFTKKIIKQEICISIPRNKDTYVECVACKQQLKNSMIEQEYDQGSHKFIRLACRHCIHLDCLKKLIDLNIQQNKTPMQCLCSAHISPFALLLIKDSQLANYLEQYQYKKLQEYQ